MTEKYETVDEKLGKRVELWESIIRDSMFSDKIKDRFLSIIRERFANGKPQHESTDDWIYFSISQLLMVVDQVSKEEGISRGDLMILFENLRDDIWQFYREINN